MQTFENQQPSLLELIEAGTAHCTGSGAESPTGDAVSTPCSLSDISGWRDGVLYPFARRRRRLERGASRPADRPAPAAWLVQRLLTADGADGDVAGNADSVFAIFGFRPTRDLADRSDRGGADELPGHRQAAASKAQRHPDGSPVYSIGWPHARARAVADLAAADFYFAIIRSATGRRPRFTQLVGLTRARGRWWIWRRRISISRLSDHDGSDPRRGEVGGRCQSHPGSIDGGVGPRFTQLVGLTRARGRWWIWAAADFDFVIIRSRRVGPTAW